MLIYCLVKPGCPRQDQSRGCQECFGIAANCRELRVWKGISDTHPQFTSLLARFVAMQPIGFPRASCEFQVSKIHCGSRREGGGW